MLHTALWQWRAAYRFPRLGWQTRPNHQCWDVPNSDCGVAVTWLHFKKSPTWAAEMDCAIPFVVTVWARSTWLQWVTGTPACSVVLREWDMMLCFRLCM